MFKAIVEHMYSRLSDIRDSIANDDSKETVLEDLQRLLSWMEITIENL